VDLNEKGKDFWQNWWQSQEKLLNFWQESISHFQQPGKVMELLGLSRDSWLGWWGNQVKEIWQSWLEKLNKDMLYSWWDKQGKDMWGNWWQNQEKMYNYLEGKAITLSAA